MTQFISNITVLVPDYDQALAFYVGKLGFVCTEDTPLGAGKRWVRVAPVGRDGSGLILGKAASEAQRLAIGNQTGGRVFLFLETDDFARDHAHYTAQGVEFLEPPRREPYGTVAVFKDPFGNQWDLIQSKTSS